MPLYSVTDAQGNVNCVFWDGTTPFSIPKGSVLSANPVTTCACTEPASASTIPFSAFWSRFTLAEQKLVWSALAKDVAASVTGGSIGGAWMQLVAASLVDLTASSVTALMAQLVTSGAITSLRSTAILTP